MIILPAHYHNLPYQVYHDIIMDMVYVAEFSTINVHDNSKLGFVSQILGDCVCRDTKEFKSLTLRKSVNYCWLKKERRGGTVT